MIMPAQGHAEFENLTCSACNAACHLRCAMARRREHFLETGTLPRHALPCGCEGTALAGGPRCFSDRAAYSRDMMNRRLQCSNTCQLVQPGRMAFAGGWEAWAVWVENAQNVPFEDEEGNPVADDASISIKHAAIFSVSEGNCVQLCGCSSDFPAVTPAQASLLAEALDGTWSLQRDADRRGDNNPGRWSPHHPSANLKRTGIVMLGRHRCFASRVDEGELDGMLLIEEGAQALYMPEDMAPADGGDGRVDSSSIISTAATGYRGGALIDLSERSRTADASTLRAAATPLQAVATHGSAEHGTRDVGLLSTPELGGEHWCCLVPQPITGRKWG